MRALRNSVKRLLQGLALIVVFPAALLTLFGRVKVIYSIFAHSFALAPSLPGSYLRAAYYKLTLLDCSIDITISLGTYFVQPDTSVGSLVSIGSYCVIGRSKIGPRTQIGSHVLIPNGSQQHLRNSDGTLRDSNEGVTVIGADCWIGDAAVVMAEVGQGATIGAGAVVTRPVMPDSVVVGNPARPIQKSTSADHAG